jgi:hypothetical protein
LSSRRIDWVRETVLAVDPRGSSTMEAAICSHALADSVERIVATCMIDIHVNDQYEPYLTINL